MTLLSRALEAVGLRRKRLVDNLPIPSTWPVEWFQMGMTPGLSSTQSATVEACVAGIAQTAAQTTPRVWRRLDDGSRVHLADSPVQRVLDKPNEFQTTVDFIMNMLYGLLLQGNAYWVGDGATPKTHTKIYLLDPRVTRARRAAETGDIFYQTSGVFAEMADVDGNVMIPARFVGHLRMHTPYDPLVGVTPLQAAAASVQANNAITNHQSAFFSNMSRPSGVLTTDMELTREQIVQLREAWNEQAKALNAGGVPILANGLSWQSLSMTSQDAEMVAAWKMTVEDISRVFRVPPMMINNMENATFSNAEALMSFWLSSGLGFIITHIEKSLDAFFGLPQREFIELDTSVLLRSDLEQRIKALGDAVTKGIYSPNEARARENLPPVEGGAMPRVQQQMVPLDFQQEMPSPAPPPAPDPVPQDGVTDEELSMLPYLVKARLNKGPVHEHQS